MSNVSSAANKPLNNNERNQFVESGEGFIDFWLIWAMVRRWWWVAALIVTLITSLVIVISFRLTPTYKSTTLLEVKQQVRNVIEFSEVESVVVDQEFLKTQIQLLRSKTLIVDTIESLNLLSDYHLTPKDDEAWLGLPRSDRLLSLVNTFDQKLGVRAVGRSRLIEVSFEHSDPLVAARIVNTLTDNYLANSLARTINSTEFARTFLEDRLKIVKESLESAERKLVEYATTNDIILVDADNADDTLGSLHKTSLKALSQALTEASVDRAEKEIRYRQAQEGNYTADILNNTALSTLREKRLELMAEYQQNLAVFKPAYPEMIELKSRIDLFDKEISQQEIDIRSSSGGAIKNSYELALAKENDLIHRVNTLRENVINEREKSIGYHILKRQVETERTQYEALLQRLKEVSVSDDLGANLIEVVDKATPARNPFKPNRLRIILITLVISILLGCGSVYVLDTIDDRIKGPDDVKKKLGQIVMGVIPFATQPDRLVPELSDPQSSISESYASLRTNIQFSGENGGPRIIQFTSTRSGEGKSVSSLGTSLRFAGVGQKVLLIDADMRRPTFKLKGVNSIGLSGVLTQGIEFEDAIHSTSHKGLDLLGSGSIVPNPSELLASTRFDELLIWATSEYDYVIIDSPPVLGLADAPIIGAKVSSTVMIVDTGVLRTPNVKLSIDRLKASGTKVLGVVLTKYKSQPQSYMNYYHYSYGSNAVNDGVDKKERREPKTKLDLMS